MIPKEFAGDTMQSHSSRFASNSSSFPSSTVKGGSLSFGKYMAMARFHAETRGASLRFSDLGSIRMKCVGCSGAGS